MIGRFRQARTAQGLTARICAPREVRRPNNGFSMKFSFAALRQEARACLQLALPLVLAQLSFVSMGTVDTVIAGRLGPRQLAAVAVGANLWFMVFVPFFGLFMAVSPIVAQRMGAGRDPAETGALVRDVLKLATATGLLWWAALWAVSGPVLDLLALEPEARGYAEGYIRAIGPGAVPFTLFFALRNAAEGSGQTRTTLVAGLLGLGVNALGAYALAFGKFGLPALGPAGCGVATAIAGAAMVASYLAMYRWHPVLKTLDLFGAARPAAAGAAAEVARLGAPIALIVTAEAWLFLIGALLMARFGTDAMAAHQIAINFASLTFMVPMSVGMATTVRVGHAAGAGDRAAVRLRGLVGIALGAVFALFSATLMAGLPRAIVGLYTAAGGVTALAVRFLYYAALFQLFDCVQATANGALRGLKDTRVPMLITVGAYWLAGLPLAAGLAFGARAGPAGIWFGFIAGLAIAAVGLSARFLSKSESQPDAGRGG
jgi:MATE family multidrug resistance protein